MTMHHAQIQITLKSATSFSMRSATLGGHQTLLHVPGAALLGAMAAEIPAAMDRWTLVHSGKVRFGDGLPFRDGRIAWPAPASLMRRKTGAGGIWPPLNTAFYKEPDIVELHNAAIAAPPEGEQWNPAKLQYLLLPPIGESVEPLHIRPRTVDRLKTAIDPVRGTSREQMLFEVEALAPDQVFLSTIEASVGAFSDNPAKDSEAFEALVETFAPETGRIVRLGRSRATEFGSAELRRIRMPEQASGGKPVSGRVIVWILSDTVILDGNGAPATELNGSSFGLKGGTWVPERSSVSSHGITPFNGFRGTSDVERQSIKAGSVIVFDAVESATSGQSRVGAYRAAGYGHVWIAPPVLSEAGFDVVLREERSERKQTMPASPPSGQLMQWMLKASGNRLQVSSERARAEQVAKTFSSLYERAEAYLGRQDTGLAGPGKSQWSEIAVQLERQRGRKSLEDLLFGNAGLIKESDPQWKIAVGPGRTFRSELIEICSTLDREAKQGGSIDPAAVIALAARLMTLEVSSARVDRAGKAQARKREAGRP